MTVTALHVRGILLPDDEQRDLYLVGDRVTFEPVAAARTVADRGWILPGLVDAHCHLGIRSGGSPVLTAEEAKAFALQDRRAGVLALRDAGGPQTFLRLDDDPEMPRLARAGRHLSEPGRYVADLALDCTAEQLPDAVAAQAKAGNGWVKLVADWIDDTVGDLTPSWDPATLRRAVDTAHATGSRVAAHTFGGQAAEALIAAGVDSVEHGTGLTTETIEAMARGRIALVPTMLAVDTFRYLAAGAQDRFPAYAAHLRSLHAGFPALVGAAHDAGVPIYAGSDAGGGVEHGALAKELLMLHREAGISKTEVLAAASWRARDWLGFGGLTEGGPADLVVYDADPRDDLAVVAAPARTILRGRLIH